MHLSSLYRIIYNLYLNDNNIFKAQNSLKQKRTLRNKLRFRQMFVDKTFTLPTTLIQSEKTTSNPSDIRVRDFCVGQLLLGPLILEGIFLPNCKDTLIIFSS